MTNKNKVRKSKQLLENKKGVDENVEKILRMIGEENEPNENEPDESGNNFKKSKLSSLVQVFHEDYQYLHKHCKQLISKLENVGHSSTGSDSSDSDSEGDQSENDVSMPIDKFNEENDWNQKLAEDHQDKERIAEAEIENLKQNADEKSDEISDLKQLLDKSIKDKEATILELSSDVANLSSENENLKILVEAAKREAGDSMKTLTVMENQIRILSSEKQIIEKERDDLKTSIVGLENKRGDMSNQLQDTMDKCSSLSSQLEKAHIAEKKVQELISENQKMKTENLMMSLEYDNLKAQEQSLGIECSQLKITLAELKTENDSLVGQNQSLESKLELLGVEVDGMTVEKEELMNNLNKERGVAKEEKERLLSEHSNCLNELEKAQSSVKELEKELEKTKVVLNDNIAELQKEKNSAQLGVNQLDASLKKLENELEQQLERISIMQKNNEDLELANSNLHNEFAAVVGLKNEAVARTVDLETKLEHKKQQISNFQEVIDDLQAAKSDMHNEIVVHQEKKNTALMQLQQSEAYLKNLESEMEQKQNQISILRQANEELQEKSSSLDKQLEEAKTNMQAEIIVLKGENEHALDNLLQSNSSIKSLEGQLEQQKEQNYILHLANEDLQKSNSSLKKQLEDAIVNLRAEVLAEQEAKTEVLSELQQSEASIKNLRNEIEQAKEQILTLHLAKEDMKNSSARLEKQLEETTTSLHGEIIALREEKETFLSELQQSHASIKSFEREMERQSENTLALQQANDDLQKRKCAMTEQLEEVKFELQKEIKLTQEDKNKVLTQLNLSESCIKDLESEITQLKEHISIEQENNSRLNKQLEESETSLHAEIVALREEKEASLSELHVSHVSIRSLERELEKQSDRISSLQQANDDMHSNNCALAEHLEEVKVELHKEIKVIGEEKDMVLAELKQSESCIKNLESEITRLKEDLSIQLENNSSLHKQFEEAILKVSDLHDKLDKVQAEAASQINAMETNTEYLEKTIDILSSQKTKLEDNLRIVITTCMENMSFVEEFEDRVTQKITDHETGIVGLQHSLRGILHSCQSLQHGYDELSTKASQIEVLRKNQIEKIDQLEEKNTEFLEKHRHLEEGNLYANKENAKLQKHIQELEVQLQLARQKLKVTEAESKCKEDGLMMAAETSQAEIRHLEQQIQQFSGRINMLEETLVQIKENAMSGVSKLAAQLDELESHFSASFARFNACFVACSEELKLLKNKLHDHLEEQKELVKENDELAIRLRERENMMSEMVKAAAEAEDKMLQLEKRVEEKEVELAGRAEEKREAIKQLSDAIDYHKNNSDDLIRYIRSHNHPRLPFCL